MAIGSPRAICSPASGHPFKPVQAPRVRQLCRGVTLCECGPAKCLTRALSELGDGSASELAGAAVVVAALVGEPALWCVHAN